jgi:hypothetical protein
MSKYCCAVTCEKRAFVRAMADCRLPEHRYDDLAEDYARLYLRSVFELGSPPPPEDAVWVFETDRQESRLMLAGACGSRPVLHAAWREAPREAQGLVAAGPADRGADRPRPWLQDLLGRMPAEEFLGRVYGRRPFYRPGGCRHLCGLADAKLLWPELLRSPFALRGDELLTHRWAAHAGVGPVPIRRGRGALALLPWYWETSLSPGSPVLSLLLEAFLDDFDVAGGVEAFVSTPGMGVQWHEDEFHVFSLQLAGSKRWYVREVGGQAPWWDGVEDNPWLGFPRRPGAAPVAKAEWAVTLFEGDWLHVPRGWEHSTGANTRSLSVTVCFAGPKASD